MSPTCSRFIRTPKKAKNHLPWSTRCSCHTLHPQAAIALATDASGMAVWAVLEHHVAGAWQPLTFVLIANYVTMHHFRFLLEGLWLMKEQLFHQP